MNLTTNVKGNVRGRRHSLNTIILYMKSNDYKSLPPFFTSEVTFRNIHTREKGK